MAGEESKGGCHPDELPALAELLGVLEKGLGKTYLQVGDRVRMLIPRNDIFTDGEIILVVEDFNHFRLADGSGFAGVVFGMAGVMNAKHAMDADENNKSTNTGGWPETKMRSYLNDTILPALPIHWQKLMKQVQVRSAEGGTRTDIVTAVDTLFLPAAAEVFPQYTGVTPYSGEVDPEAESIGFARYTDNVSRRKYHSNGTGVVSNWYLRSPDPTSTVNYHYVMGTEDNNGGKLYEVGSLASYGFSWLCCMGVECV